MPNIIFLIPLIIEQSVSIDKQSLQQIVCVHRFRVQRSGLRTKKGIEDPKSSLQMFIFPSNCQFGFKFLFSPDETDDFLVNTHPKCSPGTRMEP